MVYAPAGTRPSACATVDVPEPDRAALLASPTPTCETLARQALTIEEHYGCPMDIEWGKDGATGKIYILQARPETVQSRAGRTHPALHAEGALARCWSRGRSIGQRIGAGPARVIRDVTRNGAGAGRATCWSPT